MVDIRDFEHAWETAYISARVEKIADAVANGNYEHALDMLSMIKGKAAAAEIIKDAMNKASDQ